MFNISFYEIPLLPSLKASLYQAWHSGVSLVPKCPEKSEVQSEFGAEEDVTLDFLQQKTVSSLTLPVKNIA